MLKGRMYIQARAPFGQNEKRLRSETFTTAPAITAVPEEIQTGPIIHALLTDLIYLIYYTFYHFPGIKSIRKGAFQNFFGHKVHFQQSGLNVSHKNGTQSLRERPVCWCRFTL